MVEQGTLPHAALLELADPEAHPTDNVQFVQLSMGSGSAPLTWWRSRIPAKRLLHRTMNHVRRTQWSRTQHVACVSMKMRAC